jgi:hypothetical protein
MKLDDFNVNIADEPKSTPMKIKRSVVGNMYGQFRNYKTGVY